MDFIVSIIKFLDTNIISCLIPMILTLIIIEKIFSKKFFTKEALNIIRWIILLYTGLIILNLVFDLTILGADIIYINTGLIQLTMLFCAYVLPFTLLIKKLSSKFLYVLLIAISIKIGVFLEKYVILVTSFMRDNSFSSDLLNTLSQGILLATIQGSLISLLILAILNLKNKTIQEDES